MSESSRKGEIEVGIKIDQTKCVGCGECVEICPEDVLVMEGKRPAVRYPEECWWCDACEMDCPVGAITVRFTNHVGPVFLKKEEDRDEI